MPSDDDEIPVEPVDTSVLEDEVELRLRGDRAALIAIVNTLDLGRSAINQSGRIGHGGWHACWHITEPVMDELTAGLYDAALDDVPPGHGLVFDPDDLEALVDVDVEVLEEAGDGE